MATRNKIYIGKVLRSFTSLESMIYKIRSNDEAICPAVSQHNAALTSVMHQHPSQPAITDTGRSFPPETSNHDQSASNLQKTGNVKHYAKSERTIWQLTWGGEESNYKGVFYYYTTLPVLMVTISKYRANFVYDWPGRHTHNLGRGKGKGEGIDGWKLA